MPREFDTQAPKTCVRLSEMRSGRSDQADVSPGLGSLARVLAASRPGGVFVCLGQGAGDAGAWIVDGMDLASRLVIVVAEADEAELFGAVLGDDLRVTVHLQEPAAFLDDVHEHRFDLVTDLSPRVSPRLVELELARLAPGAFFVTRQSPEAISDMIPAHRGAGVAAADRDPDAFELAVLPEELGITLITRRIQPPRAKRRGGRRKRAGVTPLFSPRPRPSDD